MKKTFAVTLCCALLSANAIAAGKDSLWEISTTTEGSGGGQPPKMTYCVADKDMEQNDNSGDPGCRTVAEKTSGRVYTATIQCPDRMTKMVREDHSADHYTTRTETSMTSNRNARPMVSRMDARRIGRCDVAKDGNMPAHANQAVMNNAAAEAKSHQDQSFAERDNQCRATRWPADPTPFDSYESTTRTLKEMLQKAKAKKNREEIRHIEMNLRESPDCVQAKATYCQDAKKALAASDTRQGFVQVMKRGNSPNDIDNALSYCGLPRIAQKSAQFCKAALNDNDYAYLNTSCPEERKALVRQKCAGRDYTSVDPAFRSLCGNELSQQGETEESGASDKAARKAARAEARKAAAEKRKARRDGDDSGESKVKKALGF